MEEKKKRAPNRTIDERIAEIDDVISYHMRLVENLKAKRKALLEPAKQKKPTRKDVDALIKEKNLSPEQVIKLLSKG